MPKQKLMLIGGIIAVVVLLGGGGLAWKMISKKPAAPVEQQPKKRRVSAPENVIPVAERPYMQIAPLADGRNLVMIVKSLPKTATEVEYELEYQAGSLLQGAFDTIKLETVPAQKQVLLGSCSAGGACTYHTDVKGGSLLLRFSGVEDYVLKSDWRYFDNKAKETAVGSKDAKFQLDAPTLATQRYMVVYNSPGYPEGLKGTPVSDPYSLATSSPLTGTGALTMRANEEGSLAIMGWDGKAWQEIKGTVEGKTVTASAAPLLELYIVVKK